MNNLLQHNDSRHYGHLIVAIVLLMVAPQVAAQRILHRADSLLSLRYSKGGIDTAYITRPTTKWTVTARMNVSGAKIEA